MLGGLLPELVRTDLISIKTFIDNVRIDDPQRRSSLSYFSDPKVHADLFTSPIITAETILNNYLVECENDRAAKLKSLSRYLPTDFLASRIFPFFTILAETKALTSSETEFVIYLLSTLDSKLNSEDMERIVVKLFSKPDRNIRLVLLDDFDQIAAKLSPKCIQNSLFQLFMQGFVDDSPEVREKTLRCSVDLASKLTHRQLNNDLVRCYSRLQSDEFPGIRVNVIICFGRLSHDLDPTVKQKMLLSVLSTGLQDSFVPTRQATLQFLKINIEEIKTDILAKTILPLISGSLIDKDPKIISMTLSVAKLILTRIERTLPVEEGRSFSPNLMKPDVPSSFDSSNMMNQLSPSSVNNENGWHVSELDFIVKDN